MSRSTRKRSSVASIASRMRSAPALERVEVGRISPAALRSRQLLDVGALVAVLGRLAAGHPRGDRLGEARTCPPMSLT